MRSRTRNIIDAIDAVLFVALICVCIAAVNLRGDSADKSRAMRQTSQTVSSLATESQANFGRANQLEQEQLAEHNAVWNSEYNIETAASTITHNSQVGVPVSQIIPTVAYYAQAVLSSGKAWTSHVIPSSLLGDVVDLDTTYRLSEGTSLDGQPAIYVSQIKQN